MGAVERTLVLWGFIARNQFFEDCNKRTATLAANWLLLPRDLCPLSFLGERSQGADQQTRESFQEALLEFYEQGGLDPIAAWFLDRALWIARAYSPEITWSN